MSEQEAVWYYSQHGERKGPVTLEVLKGAITHMKVDREKDLVWGPGLPNWVKVAEVPELQGISSSPPPVEAALPSEPVEKKVESATPEKPAEVDKAATANPYQAPSAVDDDDNALADAMTARRQSGSGAPGIGRLKYFFYPFLVYILVGGIAGGVSAVVAKDNPQLGGMVEGVAGLLSLLFMALFTFSRLKNLGMSRWSILWSVVPLMNFWLGYRLYACPAGYQEHKKLDTSGKVMVGVYALLQLITIASFVSIMVIGAKYYKEAAEEAQRKLDMQQSEKNEVLGL